MNLINISSSTVTFMEYFFHIHLLIALLTYIIVAALLRKHLRHLRYRSVSHEKVPFEKLQAPKISVIIPARNESNAILESVHAVLSTDYPNYEVIVVNDGSTDKTLHHLKQSFELTPKTIEFSCKLSDCSPTEIFQSTIYPQLFVIDKKTYG